MNRLSAIRAMESHESPVLSIQQIAVLLDEKPENISVMLGRMAGEGLIIRVAKGMYALPSTDVRAIASGIYAPSFISLLSAFEYHGITTQSPRVIEVINPVRSASIKISLDSGDFEVRFIKTGKRMLFGFSRVYLGEKAAFIADKEKAIIDALTFRGSVPIEDVFEALKSGVDHKKMVDYARRTGKISTMKRVGYLMERAGIKVSPKEFGALSPTYVPLDPVMERRGKYSHRWRVLDNLVIT